jgi:hypothetical protein
VGETQDRPSSTLPQLSFNSLMKVDFQAARLTSDGGLILVGELEEHLGLSVLIERHLIESRRGKSITRRSTNGTLSTRSAFRRMTICSGTLGNC